MLFAPALAGTNNHLMVNRSDTMNVQDHHTCDRLQLSITLNLNRYLETFSELGIISKSDSYGVCPLTMPLFPSSIASLYSVPSPSSLILPIHNLLYYHFIKQTFCLNLGLPFKLLLLLKCQQEKTETQFYHKSSLIIA